MNRKVLLLTLVLFGALAIGQGQSQAQGQPRAALHERKGRLGTDQDDPDTDGDGLPDSWELEHFSDDGEDPLRYGADDDPDGDGVPNLAEYHFVADPNVTDTDDDGLNDYAEIYLHHTYPGYEDTDYDGLSDIEEISTYNTNPLHPDSDHDGLNDGYEVDTSTDPLAQTSWDFSFDFDGTTHTRKLNGLNVADDQWGNLDVMPWMELTIPDYSFPGRDIDLFETARQGIASWAQAGATQIGIAGVDSRMVNWDPDTPGYQNPIVDELKAIADANNIEIVFGLKLTSILTSPSTPRK